MRELDLSGVLVRLAEHYVEANRVKFDGILPPDYRITFNPYLRRLTGRITYSMRLIEISLYHYRQYGYLDAVATLEHEMLHLYLHRLGKPSGHNNLFKKAAEALGIRVFHDNPYPKNQTPRHRYIYECPACGRMVFRRRRRAEDALACGVCCRQFADGAWDDRFKLELKQKVRFG
jgi:predicted SprT family Zn-dependent metalloprotease